MYFDNSFHYSRKLFLDPPSTPFIPYQIHVLCFYSSPSSILTIHILIGVGHSLNCGQSIRGHTHKESWSSFPISLSFTQLSIARGGGFWAPSLPCWNVVLLDLGWAKNPMSEFVSAAAHHARRYCFSLGRSSFSPFQPFSPLSRIFIHKGMLSFCQGPFFITWNVLMIFDLESIYVCLYWIYLCWTSCVPGVMSTWSCQMIFWMCSWIVFESILLEIFPSMFIRETDI